MSVFNNGNQGLNEQNDRCTTGGDHVVNMGTDTDGPSQHNKSRIHETYVKDKKESQKLISQNVTLNRSASKETDKARVLNTNEFDNIQKHKSSVGCKRFNCNTNIISMCLSLVAIAAVTYFYFSREDTHVLETVTPVGNIQGEMSKLQEQKDEKIVARFVLNQKHFDDSNKTSIRWKPITNSQNAIVADTGSPCIIVPERGTYGVFSLLTFMISKNDSVDQILHFLRLKKEQAGEQHFLRKLFAVPLSERSDEMIPSNLVSFAAMEANGSICIDTTDRLRKYIFASQIDNTINIFRVS